VDIFRFVDPTRFNGLILLAALVAAVVIALLGWERYRPRHRPQWPLPTSEVFVDPATHRRLRVWVDPVSGAREYREDLDPAATPLPPLERPGLFVPPRPEEQRLTGGAPEEGLPPGEPRT
jgi:hypothetical protein